MKKNTKLKLMPMIIFCYGISAIFLIFTILSENKSYPKKILIITFFVFLILGSTLVIVNAIHNPKTINIYTSFLTSKQSCDKSNEATFEIELGNKDLIINEGERDVIDVISYVYPSNIKFVYIDVETSTRKNDRICAIGLIVVFNGQYRHLYSLINPEEHITNSIIHGISDCDVCNAPTIKEYWESISDIIGDEFVFIGHNCSFDISVMKKDLSRHSICFSPKIKVDTMQISKEIMFGGCKTQKGQLTLDNICLKLGVGLDHHNAKSDIEATKIVLEKLLAQEHRSIEDFYTKIKEASKVK